jgi:alpha-tubulin suppressor-like RCC1 family protein
VCLGNRVACRSTAVSAGAEHTCAISDAFSLHCWGSDADGQLDLAPDAGTDQPYPALTLISDTLGVTAVAAGSTFTCASYFLNINCWGDTPLGSFSTPQPIPALQGGFNLTVGEAHACAQAMSREVLCWGDDTFGQLGGGDGGTMLDPVVVPGLSQMISLAAGKTHTCAIVNGTVRCWGRFDSSGSTPYDSAQPAAVAVPGFPSALGSGDGVTCVAGSLGVTCFGKGSPSMTTYALSASEVCVGSGYACALATDAGVSCWGDNAHGQLGNPDAGVSSAQPVQVVLDGEALHLSCGRAHACSVGPRGATWCWGEGSHHKLGNGSTADQPVPVIASD